MTDPDSCPGAWVCDPTSEPLDLSDGQATDEMLRLLREARRDGQLRVVDPADYRPGEP